MLVTIGHHRLNLFNVSHFNLADGVVHFANGATVQLDKPEAEALRKYWDGHAEAIDAKNTDVTTEESGRDFALGHAETPPGD